MASPRTRAVLFSWTGALLTGGIIAVLNVLSSLAPLRLDLSAGGLYSVSPGTKAVLADLKDDLLIKVYFTRRLPAQYALNGQYLRDLLGEYRSAGRGRVKVEFLDPEGDERVKQEAMSAGVAPVRLSVMARDKFEIKEVYMGVALLYGGKSDVIAVAQNSPDYEYDLTRRIKKLSAARRKTIGLVTGHGEKVPSDPNMRPIFEPIAGQAGLEEVGLDKPLPSVVDALWILGPRHAYKPAELERLKAWVGSGRSLGILLDRRDINTADFATRPVDAGLDGLLSAWGVAPRAGLVGDLQSERVQIQQRQGGFTFMNIVEYPYMPVATNLNTKHPATRRLDAVVLPFAHPLEVATQGKPLTYTSLMDSTKDSWYYDGTSVSPFDQAAMRAGSEKGPFSLAGVIEGDFFSVTPSTWIAAPAPGRVILLGTSRLIDPNFGGKSSNISALLNLFDWSLQDEALLSIRSKGLGLRPLRRFSDGARVAVKYWMTLSLPGALLVLAFIVYRRQARRRELLAAAYGS